MIVRTILATPLMIIGTALDLFILLLVRLSKDMFHLNYFILNGRRADDDSDG